MAAASTRPNSTVYVGGLHPTLVTSTVLSEAFIPFGEIADISLPKPEAPSSTDIHRGFGYVEFEEAGDAKEAIDNMDQSELFGRVIKVALAKPEKKSNEAGGLGSKTAIWEQVGSMIYFSPQNKQRLTYNTGGISGGVCCVRGGQISSPAGETRSEQSTRRSHARIGRIGRGRTKAGIMKGSRNWFENCK